MKKHDYLSDMHVQAFTDWFARQLGSDSSIGHHYLLPGGIQVGFANLCDALERYNWRFAFDLPGGKRFEGSSFNASKQGLGALKTMLDDAIAAKDDETACETTCAVMQWGGVANGNVAWLRRNRHGLATLLGSVADSLAAASSGGTLALAPSLRFNAGMTKVYSLLVPDFVIYDSRVAAALAWFVMRWKSEHPKAFHGAIPPTLDFPCMPAKEGPNAEIRKVRNPGTLPWTFQQMRNRPLLHAEWNLRASWLLAAALEKADSPFGADDHLRALEAALFMWGYDVGPNSPWLQTIQCKANAELEEEHDVLPEGAALGPATRVASESLRTRGGKAINFRWNFDESGDELVIVNDNEREIRLPVSLVFQAMHTVYDWFGAGRIPLANNVEKMHQATERLGLGTALRSCGGDNAQGQAASYLGPILESLGWFAWNGRTRGIEFSFLDVPPSDLAVLRERLSAYAR